LSSNRPPEKKNEPEQRLYAIRVFSQPNGAVAGRGPEGVCRLCGKSVSPGSGVCASCAPSAAAERISKAAERGRIIAHTPTIHARIAETQRRNAAARLNWDPSSQPAWLKEEAYAQRVQPRLATVSISAISTALGVSWPYARDIPFHFDAQKIDFGGRFLRGRGRGGTGRRARNWRLPVSVNPGCGQRPRPPSRQGSRGWLSVAAGAAAPVRCGGHSQLPARPVSGASAGFDHLSEESIAVGISRI
jgi:hypothetical protein